MIFSGWVFSASISRPEHSKLAAIVNIITFIPLRPVITYMAKQAAFGFDLATISTLISYRKATFNLNSYKEWKTKVILILFCRNFDFLPKNSSLLTNTYISGVNHIQMITEWFLFYWCPQQVCPVKNVLTP